MSNTSDDDEEMLDVVVDPAKAVLIPTKSRERYQSVYEAFVQWKKVKKVKLVTENIILEYFSELSKKYKPPTLWSIYSMLRCTLNIHENLHIENYKHLSAFLKIKSSGYRGKQSKVFSAKDIENFLETAPDQHYLATKVILIFGISGACQSSELLKLTVNDLMNRGDIMVVKVRDRAAKTVRSFILEGEYLKTTLAYQALRPPNTATDRVFINYHDGKCTNQAIGKNKLGRMPREIAKFLKLPNPEQYTGHSFRRSSVPTTTSVYVDEDIQNSAGLESPSSERIEIQRLGGWSEIIEGDVDESVGCKRKNGQQISSTIDESFANTIIFDEEPTKRIKTEVYDNEDSAASTSNNFLTGDEVTGNDENTHTTSIDWNGRTVSLHFTNCSTVNIKFVH